MTLTNIGTVKEILGRHGFNFSKGLGQNFLINPDVCPRIAEMGNAREGYGILEIGTGIGVLTKELALRADKVSAVEIDTRLMPVLDETLKEFNNIKIYNEDVMKADLQQIIADDFAGLNVAVCANLPYYITSPVIMLLLESRLPIDSITVMVQKEAADRICAEVGSRASGAVTVAVNYYSTPETLFKVSRGSFMPPPNVDSAVIRLEVRPTPPIEVVSEKEFFGFVRAAFGQRRKTLVNSVGSAGKWTKESVKAALGNAGLNENIRAEALTMQELAAVFNGLS